MKRILPGLYTFTGLGAGRVYLIRDPDGMTLVDAGLPLAPARILRQITAAGGEARQVKRILITHAHPDHIGGLHALQAATGADVVASALERRVIVGESAIPGPPRESLPAYLRPFPRPETRFPPTPVARTVAEGDRVPEALGGLQVIAVPGHAPGHVAYWQPERRILFCGDVVMHLAGLRLPPRLVTVDWMENQRSAQKLAGLGAALVLFGHGAPLRERAADRLRAFAARLRDV